MIFNTTRTSTAAQRIKDSDYSGPVKSVCLTALEAVGRLRWAGAVSDFNVLIPGNKINTGKWGCVCYQAPITLAVLANQLQSTRADQWFKKADLNNPKESEQKLLHYLYTRCLKDIGTWFPGTNIPAGAMVFHGRPDNPCAHVTLYVGNAEVVSCWGPIQAGIAIREARGLGSEEYKIYDQETLTLGQKRLVPDTVDIPLLSFTSAKGYASGQAFVKFTRKPFWELW
jgi:hypothetical protein